MPRPSWERVSALFHAVMDLPAAAQRQRLADVEDLALVREVLDLVRAERQSRENEFLADSITAVAADLAQR